MSFYNEVEKLFTADEIKADYTIHMFGDRVIVIEGYKKIVAFSDTEITIKLVNGGNLTIVGAKMVIKHLEKGELVINGEILSVTRMGV